MAGLTKKALGNIKAQIVKRITLLEAISIPEAAWLKGCTRATIYNNRGAFRWTQDGKRLYPDAAFKAWQPAEKGTRPRKKGRARQ